MLIPAKDEARWIRECLDSVAAQDYPLHMIEVFVVVDAASSDDTDVVAKEFLDDARLRSHARSCGARVAAHPGNLNAGLTLARGDVLCRVDARSRIPSGIRADVRRAARRAIRGLGRRRCAGRGPVPRRRGRRPASPAP